MGQGTSAAPTGTPGMPSIPGMSGAAPGAAPSGQTATLSDNQVKAIAMLMSNLDKSGQTAQGMGTPQGQGMYPQTSTIQGGTYFNPHQQR